MLQTSFHYSCPYASPFQDFGKTLEKGVVDLADDALKHAQHFAEQGERASRTDQSSRSVAR